MPLHKSRRLIRRPYDGESSHQLSALGTLQYSPTSTDKSSDAARMAQQLASQSSWADTYVPAGSNTIPTPEESIADTQSQIDNSEAPPSYEAARLERELPSIPHINEANVRQEPSHPIVAPARFTLYNMEAGPRTPLLKKKQIVRRHKRKQSCFIVMFVMLAVLLMSLQALKGFRTGFRRTDGTLLPPLPRRQYSRFETSHPIKGMFTFYDSLELATTSGAIDITIDPQPSDKIGEIKVTSRSGSIKVKFTDEYMKGVTTSGLLDRIYNIEIRSSSGSQTVELPQGNGGNTSLTSESGSLSVKLFMTRSGQHKTVNTFITETKDGSQKIKVKPTSSESITGFAARIQSKNHGSMKLGLPPTWEGMVHAFSGGAGSVDVKGENLDLQHYGNREVYARRVLGRDEKDLKRDMQVVELVGNGSGSIKVDCSFSSD